MTTPKDNAMPKPTLLIAKTTLSYEGQMYGENQQFYAESPVAEALVASGQAAAVDAAAADEEKKVETVRAAFK